MTTLTALLFMGISTAQRDTNSSPPYPSTLQDLAEHSGKTKSEQFSNTVSANQLEAQIIPRPADTERR